MLEAGWKAVEPGKWIPPPPNAQEVHEVDDNNDDVEQVMRRLSKDLRDRAWRHTQGYMMGGMGPTAPSMEAARIQHKRFLQAGEVREAKALECVITRNTWTGDRLAKDKARDGKCQRCGGQELETALHRYWQCADNAKIDHKAIKESKKLVSQAGDGPECLWMGGLIPGHCISAPILAPKLEAAKPIFSTSKSEFLEVAKKEATKQAPTAQEVRESKAA